MNKIDYETILGLLSTFSSMREDCSDNSKNAQSGFSSFASSGVNIQKTDYASSIENRLSSLTTNTEILLNDYDRIINYLNNLATAAKEAADKAITAVEAHDTWNATETVDG